MLGRKKYSVKLERPSEQWGKIEEKFQKSLLNVNTIERGRKGRDGSEEKKLCVLG